jgi:hypothetical protein
MKLTPLRAPQRWFRQRDHDRIDMIRLPQRIVTQRDRTDGRMVGKRSNSGHFALRMYGALHELMPHSIDQLQCLMPDTPRQVSSGDTITTYHQLHSSLTALYDLALATLWTYL